MYMKRLQLAQDVGFTNISIDLIYGLPGQTLDDFKDTLNQALALDLPHYSSYSLIVEPKTVFYNSMQKGKLNLPPQELEASMYELVMEDNGASMVYINMKLVIFLSLGLKAVIT